MTLYKQLNLIAYLLSKPDDFIIEQLELGGLEEVLKDTFPFYENISLSENIIENINYNYTYLFVGASAPLASPYVSSYYRKNNRLMDKPAITVMTIMNKWGISLDESNIDLPDHLVNILAIISELLQYKERLVDEVLIDQINKDIDELIGLLDFLPQFKEKIKNNEKGNFYWTIVDILSKLLSM